MVKRNINKFVCFILVIVMIMTLSSTALAAGKSDSSVAKEDSLSEEWSPKQLYLSDNGHGEYRILTNKELTASKERSATVAKLTEIDGLYQLDDKSHVYQSADDTCFAVERIDFTLTNKKEIAKMQSQYDLPKEVIEGIEERAGRCKVNTDKNAGQASLIVPKSSTRSTVTDYYTYNGYSLKDYVIFIPSDSTGTFQVKKGEDTKHAADAVVNLLLIGGGIASTTVGLFGAGISALQVFYNWANINTVSGHGKDFLEAKITYSHWEKWTYVKHSNTWRLGCKSERVYVKEVKTIQHYVNYSSNYEHVKRSYPKKTRKSANFTSPKYKAIYCFLGNTWVDEKLRAKYYNKTIMF